METDNSIQCFGEIRSYRNIVFLGITKFFSCIPENKMGKLIVTELLKGSTFEVVRRGAHMAGMAVGK